MKAEYLVKTIKLVEPAKLRRIKRSDVIEIFQIVRLTNKSLSTLAITYLRLI